jgi:hypothetical protein
MDMSMSTVITPSATMSMAMPTSTAEGAVSTVAAMSMSMGDTGGCKLSVSALLSRVIFIDALYSSAPGSSEVGPAELHKIDLTMCRNLEQDSRSCLKNEVHRN